ncbi:MAG: hypothetical protein U0172_02705 [Nitrospiraceae bacterium]
MWVLFLWIWSLTAPHPAHAAEWSAEPAFTAKGIYNSNLLVTPQRVEVMGFSTTPSLTLMGSTETLSVSSRLAMDFVEYRGDKNTSFTNIFLPLSAKYHTERDTFEFEGGYTRDNTLMGELHTTGIVANFTQRNLVNVAPKWSHALSEQWSLQAGYQYSDASYQDGLRLGLIDYRVHAGTTALQYQATEQDQLQLSAVYVDFRTSTFPLKAQYPGLFGTAVHNFSESLTGTVFGGAKFLTSSTVTTSGPVSEHATVWVYGATLRKQFETTGVSLEFNRDVVPSGFGLLIKTDRVSLAVVNRTTERLTLALDARANFSSRATTTAAGNRFPDFFHMSVIPRAAWKLDEHWMLEAAYTFAEFDTESFVRAGVSHSGWIGVTYTFSKWALSR